MAQDIWTYPNYTGAEVSRTVQAVSLLNGTMYNKILHVYVYLYFQRVFPHEPVSKQNKTNLRPVVGKDVAGVVEQD